MVLALFHTENPSSSSTTAGDKCNPSYFYFCLRSHGEKSLFSSSIVVRGKSEKRKELLETAKSRKRESDKESWHSSEIVHWICIITLYRPSLIIYFMFKDNSHKLHLPSFLWWIRTFSSAEIRLRATAFILPSKLISHFLRGGKRHQNISGIWGILTRNSMVIYYMASFLNVGNF